MAKNVHFIHDDMTWLDHVNQIETWLESPFVPQDGTKELIQSQIKRGHEYPSSRTKCWTHLWNEMQDLPDRPVFRTERNAHEPEPQPQPVPVVEKNTPEVQEEALSSPNRGSIRPGKTLSRNDATPEPKVQPTMMERQAQWLEKKQRKADAERLRQNEEQEKELTFAPQFVTSHTSNIYANVRSKINNPSPRESANASTNQHRVDTRPRRKSLDARPVAPHSSRKKIIKRKSVAPGPVSSLLDTVRSEIRASAAMVSHSARSESESSTTTSDDSLVVSESTDEENIREDPVSDTHKASEEPHVQEEKPEMMFQYNLSGSTESKGRHNVRDASLFEINSFYRKRDKYAGRPGITLQVGRRHDTYAEQVVAILFDKAKISELEAGEWWAENNHRFVDE